MASAALVDFVFGHPALDVDIAEFEIQGELMILTVDGQLVGALVAFG